MSLKSLIDDNQKPWLNGRLNSLKIDQEQLPAAANTSLSALQSGKVFLMPTATANNVISLPAPVAGLNFKFIVQAAANGTNTQTIQATGAILDGSIVGTAATVVITAATNQTNLILSATAADSVPGSFADLYCDGSAWIYYAYSAGANECWSTS